MINWLRKQAVVIVVSVAVVAAAASTAVGALTTSPLQQRLCDDL